MKLALAMMFQNEANWLELHLPAMLSAIDGLVTVDGGSSDGGDAVVKCFGGTVYYRKFEWNFGEQAQFLLECVEGEGYDLILRLDPDEIMFASDILKIKENLSNSKPKLLYLPRINFVRDRTSYSENLDRHGQWRAWTLKKGVSYRHNGSYPVAHETPSLPSGKIVSTETVDQKIYHYGAIRDPYFSHWRSLSYQMLCAGKEMPKYDPVYMPWFEHTIYEEAQPLIPEEVGYRAPLEAISMNYHLSNNLAGDRSVEYSFVINNIPKGTGRALDFGSGGISILTDCLVEKGWDVTALDQEEIHVRKGVKRVVADILTHDLEQYDLILCCSTIEHVGLIGRYGSIVDVPDGDFLAMQKLKNALSVGAKLIVTLPVGLDKVHKPMHRVYGSRLEKLFDGLSVLKAEFWCKDSGSWEECSGAIALSGVSILVSTTDWQGSIYSLGCFVLEKK